MDKTSTSPPVARLIWEEEVQDLIEYALLSAFLGVACITGLLQLAGIRELFAAAGAALNSAIS